MPKTMPKTMPKNQETLAQARHALEYLRNLTPGQRGELSPGRLVEALGCGVTRAGPVGVLLKYLGVRVRRGKRHTYTNVTDQQVDEALTALTVLEQPLPPPPPAPPPAPPPPPPVVGSTPATIEGYKRHVRELGNRVAGLEATLADRSLLADMLRDTVERVGPFEAPELAHALDASKTITAVLALGDWHIGELIRAVETEGLNEYDHAIAGRRLTRIILTFLEWIEVQRHAYTIDECVVIGLGDMIGGGIHEELRIYEEFAPPVQAVKAGYMLAWALERLSKDFPRVRASLLCADNHGRITKKVFSSGRGEWSLGYVVNAIAQVRLERIENVTIDNIIGIKHVVDVAGKGFLIEHGNDYVSQLGRPHYGITRGEGREAKRRMCSDAPSFNYMMMGHWHEPAIYGEILVNGALCGTTPYDVSKGRYSVPCQCAMLVHPHYGIFNWMPVFGND